jgi:hypothetical protein
MNAKLFVKNNEKTKHKLKLDVQSAFIHQYDLKLYADGKEYCLRNNTYYALDCDFKELEVTYSLPEYEAVIHDLNDLNIKQIFDNKLSSCYYIINPTPNIEWKIKSSIKKREDVEYEIIEYCSDDLFPFDVATEKYIIRSTYNVLDSYDYDKWDFMDYDCIRKWADIYLEKYTERHRGVILSVDTIEDVKKYKEEIYRDFDKFIYNMFLKNYREKVQKIKY